MPDTGWRVIEREGSASELFDAAWFDALPAQRIVARLHPIRPAVVLGSSQHEAIVDGTEAERLGVDVVRRRSGGGAVWLDDSLEWLDIVLPAGDLLGETDVQKAFLWLGDVFVAVLRELDPKGEFDVHRGSLARDPLNKLICFAGLGAGEVTRNGRKVVGISQRRTKRYTLFQCGILRSWEPLALVRLLHPGLLTSGLVTASDAATLASGLLERCVGVGGVADRAVQTLIARLPDGPPALMS